LDGIYHVESIEALRNGDAGCEAVVDTWADDGFEAISEEFSEALCTSVRTR
jgi:hypothetical protein